MSHIAEDLRDGRDLLERIRAGIERTLADMDRQMDSLALHRQRLVETRRLTETALDTTKRYVDLVSGVRG